MGTDVERYVKLPHDDWYDDWTWREILGPDGSARYGSSAYEGADVFDPTRIAAVELWHVEEGSYGPEHSAAALFRMEDGTYVVYTGWCDTTGWGCRDDARFTFHPTRGHAMSLGFGDEERRWFSIELPPEGSS